ncbi:MULTISPECIES: hypothetical protein [unclassified Kitasatospora]|uniref:hypothetical protein n=1 Tax=unclassified Kitasatospora TaxID=2633591 RepID=UPI0006710067|nr:hypothetical protein [Kitasatospora sp. MY 5-36]
MRRSVLPLVSSAPLVLVLSLLGAPVPVQAAPRAPAGPASAAPTRAIGTFAVRAQDCGPWGCQYALAYFVLEDPAGCYAVPPAPSPVGSRWTRWGNGTDRNAQLFTDGACAGAADAVLGEKSTIEFSDAPYHSVRFG